MQPLPPNLGPLSRVIVDATFKVHSQLPLRSSYSYQGKRESTSPVVVWHNAQFGLILAKRVRKPHPPYIQTALKRAHELAARLAADLAPEIQQHIQAMPPSNCRSVVTKRRLRLIARTKDRLEQLEGFRRLLALPVRASKQPLLAVIRD